jgi:hypothetical protein
MSVRTFSEKWGRLIEVDLRSLALARISLGAILFFDLCSRALDLTSHYSDEGLFSRSLVSGIPRIWTLISPHLWSGSVQYELCLLLIQLALALLLISGFLCRWATFLSWFLLASLQFRNPLVAQGGDRLLLLLLFWGNFLPWGKCFTVHNRVKNENHYQFRSWATVAVYAQFISIYLFAAWWKLKSPTWFVDGSAVQFVFRDPVFGNPFSAMLSNFPTLCRILSRSVVILEGSIPILFLSPWQPTRLRCFGLCGLGMMHLGMLASLHVGLFPFVSLATLLFFVPSTVLNRSRSDPRAPVWRKVSTVNSLFVTYLMLVGFLCNVEGIYPRIHADWWEIAARHFLLQQWWGVFRNPVALHSHWIRAKGVTGNHGDVLLTADGIESSTPDGQDLASQNIFVNHRWRRYLLTIVNEPAQYPIYADFLCRQWNRLGNNTDPLTQIEIWVVSAKTPYPATPVPVQSRKYGVYPCHRPGLT